MKNIVIVDDDSKITEMLKIYVKNKGFNPICFNDGDKAWKHITSSNERTNLLITDFEMPIMKGIDLIKNCNSNDFNFPKILLTSHSEKNLLIESINNQVFCFIEKPFNFEQFDAKFKEAIALDDDLEKSDDLQKLGEVYTTIIHEINNPLNLIIMFTDLIKRNCTNSKLDSIQLLNQLENIKKSGLKISDIINDVKELINSKPTNIENINLDQLFLEIQLGLKVINSSEKVKLELEKTFDNFNFDKTQIYRLLINLLSNSCDAISDLEEKWIKILAYKDNDNIFIRVSDSGKGIPEELVPNIFSKKFSNKKSIKGTGLGLSICKKILESYDGSIKYELFNGNTSFLITIPEKNENNHS